MQNRAYRAARQNLELWIVNFELRIKNPSARGRRRKGKDPTSRKERIMHFLLANGRKRAMAGAENRVIRKRENILPVGVEGVGVRDTTASHRSGEHSITDYRDAVR